MLVEEVSWSWSRAGEQRVGLLIQRPGFLCRRVKPLHGIGKLKPGGGLAGRFSTTSSSRRQCWWWGRIWFISHCDSFYKLCSVSLRLRLPEQTETGAIRVLARRGISNILPQSVLLFLTQLLGGIFWKYMRMVASARDEL